MADHRGQLVQVAVSSQIRPGPGTGQEMLEEKSLDSVAAVTFPSTSRELFFAMSEHLEMDFYALCVDTHACS